MNKTKAQTLARTLMTKHGVGHMTFEFDRGLRRLGATHFLGPIPLKITLSAHFVELLPEDEIREVILHEIAHALAGHKAGHGPQWKRHARALGIKGDRCAVPSARPDAAWEAVCPKGHKGGSQHRAPGRVKACGKCSRTWQFENVYTWKKNGRTVPLSAMPAKYQQEFNLHKVKSALRLAANVSK